MTRTIARWESLRGKYWVELYADVGGYSYKGDGCGGVLHPLENDDAAEREMGSKLHYLFPGRVKRTI